MESNLPAADVAHSAPAPTSRKYGGFALRIGLGIAIVGFLLWHYDARPALRSLARERPMFFVGAVALYVAGQLLCAWRWRLLAAIIKVHGPLTEFLRYTFIGIFTNLFVPGLVGGDAARAFYLGRSHGRMGEAIASALADRAYGLMGLFWLAGLVAITMNHATLTAGVIRSAVAVGAIAVAGYLASPLIARIIPMMPRAIHRALGIVVPFFHRPAAVLPAIAISMVFQASLAVCQYILARGLGINLPLSMFLLIVPISGVLAAMPLTLNGLGLRETAYLFLFGMAGVTRDDAIALGLLYFLATMIGGLFGAIAFVTTEVPHALVHDEAETSKAASSLS
ncbi:MAG TPA: lysylphosphatidylglycerol synthase transmembrane domain-containing protein [Candidatus Binataceae bacterium]|nr:lysylphosphatidylglycerol synthase transmembrane domain-containing protein [Candidatus Binataceae bacterium]